MLDRDLVRGKAAEVAAGLTPGSDTGNIELSDLDSFTIVETVVALEDAFGVAILPEIGAFSGGTFDELADFVLRCDGRAPAEERR